MSFQRSLFVGALMVGVVAQSVSYSAEVLLQSDSPVESHQLLRWMKWEGVKKVVDLSQRADLEGLVAEARARAEEVDSSCIFDHLSEIFLARGEVSWIAGYEAFVACEDTAASAVALYFDANKKYLGAFDLSN